MVRVGMQVFGKRTPVRTAREFGLVAFRHTAKGGEYVARESFDELAGAARDLQRRIGRAVEARLDFRTILGDQSTQDAFVAFARPYRELLRPVDAMLEDQLRSTCERQAASMREYYLALKGEAATVAAFKQFWDRVTECLSSLERVLVEDHGADDLEDLYAVSRVGRLTMASRPTRRRTRAADA